MYFCILQHQGAGEMGFGNLAGWSFWRECYIRYTYLLFSLDPLYRKLWLELMRCSLSCDFPTTLFLWRQKILRVLQNLLRICLYPITIKVSQTKENFPLSLLIKNNDITFPNSVRGLQPRSVSKIAYSDQLFELSWTPPFEKDNVVSYTVFWCLSENNRDRPYQVK